MKAASVSYKGGDAPLGMNHGHNHLHVFGFDVILPQFKEALRWEATIACHSAGTERQPWEKPKRRKDLTGLVLVLITLDETPGALDMAPRRKRLHILGGWGA